MLKFWFGASNDESVITHFGDLSVKSSAPLTLLTDRDGMLHLIDSGKNRFPISVSVTIPYPELFQKSNTQVTLKDKLWMFFENRNPVYLMDSSTLKAYLGKILDMDEKILGSSDMNPQISAGAVSIEIFVEIDGSYTNIDSLASISWRER